MNDNKVKGAKNALLTSLLYYYRALELEGCEDIKKQITTDVALSLKLSKEQSEFLYDCNIIDLEKIIDDMIILANTLNDTEIKGAKDTLLSSLNDLKKRVLKV